GRKLRVSAESKILEEHDKDGYAIREHRFGKFSRTLQLPHGVKVNTLDAIQANMDNGVLTVTFPKTTRRRNSLWLQTLGLDLYITLDL
ncbi:hypothetical protein C8F01DRAFT_999661, partial [Mycena amicta]